MLRMALVHGQSTNRFCWTCADVSFLLLPSGGCDHYIHVLQVAGLLPGDLDSVLDFCLLAV